MISITRDIAREIQAIWQKRGFYDGEIDGVADPDFQNMLVSFMDGRTTICASPPSRRSMLPAARL